MLLESLLTGLLIPSSRSVGLLLVHPKDTKNHIISSDLDVWGEVEQKLCSGPLPSWLLQVGLSPTTNTSSYSSVEFVLFVY